MKRLRITTPRQEFAGDFVLSEGYGSKPYPIGNYLEIRFLRHLGVTDTLRVAPGKDVEVYGFELEILHSAIHGEPETVRMDTASRHFKWAISACVEGELYGLRPVLIEAKGHSGYTIEVRPPLAARRFA